MAERGLAVTLLTSSARPGWQMCYLRPESASLTSISTLEAQAFAELLASMSGHNASIVAWFATEDSQSLPRPPNARELPRVDPDPDPVLWRFFPEPSELSHELPEIWAAVGGVRVYPARNERDVEQVVVPHFKDRSDETRLGLDQGNMWFTRTKRPVLGLLGAILHTMLFATRLVISKRYRRQLLDPFQYVGFTSIAEQQGAHMWKGGHDNDIHLEFMSASSDVGERLSIICRKLGIEVTTVRAT